MTRTAILQLERRIMVLQFELTLIRPCHYADSVAFKAYLNNRQRAIKRLKDQLWNATFKSRFFVRPKPPLGEHARRRSYDTFAPAF